jgi:hypothetical protein
MPTGDTTSKKKRTLLLYLCGGVEIVFVLSAQNDCFLLGHENEFLVETVKSRLQTLSNAPTKQSSCARNINTIFSTTAFENFCFF